MKLLALLIGLVIERLATQLFHLRELRWLDRLIDAGFNAVDRVQRWPTLIPVGLLAVLLILPVLLIRLALADTLYGFPYLILAIVVLFFSLGPKDIGEDIDEYCKALEAGDEEHIVRSAKALMESDVPEDPMERVQRVEQAVCVQANNRLFAVIFWFVLLGPVGAWAYRVTDLVRRRAVFKATREETRIDERIVVAATTLHGWLAWIPARLTAIGYGMAGDLDGALSAWKSGDESRGLSQGEQSERLLARVGAGALALQTLDGESAVDRGIRGGTAASGLVFRLLFIWAAVIAAMTLYGWSV
ncbi:MAG: regulatory signaling modulator protein AmpE [Gammaproteobacteria bacterium]|nr:regulatory signaling modulator protein AmpE [Gammaproteobacteria bacterium]